MLLMFSTRGTSPITPHGRDIYLYGKKATMAMTLLFSFSDIIESSGPSLWSHDEYYQIRKYYCMGSRRLAALQKQSRTCRR